MTMTTIYHETVSARGGDWRRTQTRSFFDQIKENYAPAKTIRSEKSTSLLGLVPADISSYWSESTTEMKGDDLHFEFKQMIGSC